MSTHDTTLIALEKKFWQSMVSKDTETALQLLCEPSMMVSAYGAMQFDHAAYRKMAEQGTMEVRSFELSDVQVAFPNATTAVVTYQVMQEVATKGKSGTLRQQMNDSSTWVKQGDHWLCAIHTETPAQEEKKKAAH